MFRHHGRNLVQFCFQCQDVGLEFNSEGLLSKLAKVAVLTRKASVELALRFRLFVHCFFDLAAMFLHHEVWVEQLKNYNTDTQTVTTPSALAL